MSSPGRCKAWQEVVVRHSPGIEQGRTHVRKLTHRGKRGWWWCRGQPEMVVVPLWEEGVGDGRARRRAARTSGH